MDKARLAGGMEGCGEVSEKIKPCPVESQQEPTWNSIKSACESCQNRRAPAGESHNIVAEDLAHYGGNVDNWSLAHQQRVKE
jgi:hypothetical protein